MLFEISWQARHFTACRADFVAGAVVWNSGADFVAGASTWELGVQILWQGICFRAWQGVLGQKFRSTVSV